MTVRELRRTRTRGLTLLTALLAASAGLSQTASPPCKTLAIGPDDAGIAAPANHTVLFEDADVRVLDVHSQPGTREAVHTHRLPSVMYFESSGAGTYDSADGTVHRSHPTDPNFKPEVRAIKPEGPHYTANTGDVPFHAIRVEFKHPGCGLPGWHAATPGPDDVLPAAPGSHTLLFENDEVRVLDVHLAAHQSEPMRIHPWPGVIYVAADAPTHDSRRGAEAVPHVGSSFGVKVVPVDPEDHAFENGSDQPLHLIWFELKYGSVRGATVPPKNAR